MNGYKYYITLHSPCALGPMSFGINGIEAAYEAWCKAVEFMAAVGAWGELWSNETGEILEDFGFEDEDEDA